MTQLDLITYADEHPARARATDPASSHEAAERAEKSGRIADQQTRVLEGLRRYGPCSTATLAQLSGMDRYVVARRMPELEKLRLVRRLTARDGRNHVAWIAEKEGTR